MPEPVTRCFKAHAIVRSVPLTRIRFAMVWFAVCALLVVTTVSVLPGHDHDNAARPCSICQSGHLPCLQSAVEIQFCMHMPVFWPVSPENLERRARARLGSPISALPSCLAASDCQVSEEEPA
jgi:hypothetical protein